MANLDISDPVGIVDKRRGRGTTAAHSLAEINNTSTVSSLRTRLAAINGAYYTAARLDAMSKNDMLYALRLATADSASF